MIERINHVMMNLYDSLSMRRVFKWLSKENKLPTQPFKSGEKIVVLGNGPSQNLFWDNMEPFEGYELLCVNSFITNSSDLFFKVKPKYYCIIDPIYFDYSKAVATGYAEVYKETMNVLEKVDWDMYIITWERYDINITNKNIKQIRICSRHYLGSSKEKEYELCLQNKASFSGETVAEPAILFAIIFGFKKIALFGIDHDDFKEISFDGNGEIYISTQHAYEEDGPEICYIRGEVGNHTPIYIIFDGYAKLFKAYWDLEALAKKVGCEIINYNSNSYVDAFKKIL